MNGVLIIDKPAGLTSHDVINRVRRIFRQRSVGHLGTLDPSATGVLPLVLGSLTRLAQFYTSSEKTYEGVIRFGFATDTYDAEGEPVGAVVKPEVSLEEVVDLARQYCGVSEQIPPPFSAKKVRGIPAYKLARQHQEVSLRPVKVEIKEFEILGVEGDRARFRARVASGTYIRSVAHEMGVRTGQGAHLASLNRTKLGEFELSEAHTLEQVEESACGGNDNELLVHPRKLLPQFPAVTATEEMATRIRSGRTVNLPDLSTARQVKVFYGQRELIAIATRIGGTLFHPKIVLPAEPAPQLARGNRQQGN